MNHRLEFHLWKGDLTGTEFVVDHEHAAAEGCLCNYISMGAIWLGDIFNGFGAPVPKIVDPKCPWHGSEGKCRP